jgi:putative ABC transport system permease protein
MKPLRIGRRNRIFGYNGLYGVIACSVSQRTYEIGIRMAVGASNRQVMRMVLLQGLRSSAIAVIVGIGGCLASRGGTRELFNAVNPNDPTIYIGVLLLVLAVSGAACYIPARRASMVDPNITLRS